jgi:uncharacterized cupin superfamily protein
MPQSAAYLDADEVLRGSLPLEISMEPIISGAPFAFEKVVFDGREGFFAVWACDAGVYPRVKDRRGSFMYILSGDATITDDDGTQHVLTAGSVILLPFGWVGRWDIRETIRKVYLHTTPAAPLREGIQPSVFASAEQVAAGEFVVFDGPDGLARIWAGDAGSQPRFESGQGGFVYVISGTGEISDSDGTTHPLSAGASLALPMGWDGAWKITTPMRIFTVASTPRGGESS